MNNCKAVRMISAQTKAMKRCSEVLFVFIGTQDPVGYRIG